MGSPLPPGLCGRWTWQRDIPGRDSGAGSAVRGANYHGEDGLNQYSRFQLTDWIHVMKKGPRTHGAGSALTRWQAASQPSTGCGEVCVGRIQVGVSSEQLALHQGLRQETRITYEGGILTGPWHQVQGGKGTGTRGHFVCCVLYTRRACLSISSHFSLERWKSKCS